MHTLVTRPVASRRTAPRRFFAGSTGQRPVAARTVNLTECVLPPVALRQWVLTFPFAWRSRLGFDAAPRARRSSSTSCARRWRKSASPRVPTAWCGSPSTWIRSHLATLYEAVDDGALPILLPKFVRKELEGYLDCGPLIHVRGVSGTSHS